MRLSFSDSPSQWFISGLAAAVLPAVVCSAALQAQIQSAAESRPRAGVWLGDVPGGDSSLARALGTETQAAGYEVDFLDSAALTNCARLTNRVYALLVLPGAHALPIESAGPIDAHLREGGNLLATGLPGWQTSHFRVAGRWLSRAEYDRVIGSQKAQHVVFDFAAERLDRWIRHSSDAQSPQRREVVWDSGLAALHVVVDRLTSWDTFASPVLQPREVFPAGHSLTCFRARGGPVTKELALEWREQDGSRWIASVALKPGWEDYSLTPEAFRPWEPPPGRGGAGDRLDVRRVVQFTVGLALSHNSLPQGRHEYWFADLGTAPSPFGDGTPPSDLSAPRIESFSPGYQCFPITTPAVVRAAPGQNLFNETATAGPPALEAMHPRPRGVGFGQGRPWRWQPLQVAYDAQTSEHRGAVSALIVHEARPYRGGCWALFTPRDSRWYKEPKTLEAIGRVVARMKHGVFLLEGGAKYFTVFPSQAVPIGAEVANWSSSGQTGLTVRLSVRDRRSMVPAFEKEWALEIEGGKTRSVGGTWAPAAWSTDQYVVRTELLWQGKPIDLLEHELNRWEPSPQPRFVAARDGGFHLNGQPWKAHGVNYMPSSGIGISNDYFEHWMGRGAYDPEVIQRDLERIKAMGMNSVSVFVYYRSLEAQHLLDFLFRCRQLNLRVNQSLRPGTPMDFRWPEMKALIEHYRLAENDTVFAYDLAWEPSHFDHAYQQQHYGRLWTDWAARRHGSIELARTHWGRYETSLQPSGVAEAPVPPMRQLTQDGPWRKLVADYRDFLDDLLGERYAEARRLVRSTDPHHPVSFRMQHAGDPTYNSEGMLPYDIAGLARAVDIWEPEAYGRIGNWEAVKPGHFTASYARLCDPTKPVLWAEMGYTVWDMRTMAPSPQRLQAAADFYRDFYRMMRESGADGVFFWWYPGGYRLNERSDFGIINPDGTDRPVTRVIRDEGAAYLQATKPPLPSEGIAVDRDRDARGLFGIYEASKAEYWQAIDRGQPKGLRWLHRPGER